MPITSHGHFPARLLSSPFHKAVNQHHYAYQLPRKTSSAHSPGEQDQNVFVSFPQIPTPLLPLSFPTENWLPTKHKFLRQNPSASLPSIIFTFPYWRKAVPTHSSRIVSPLRPGSTHPPNLQVSLPTFFLCYKHASHLKTASFTFTSNYLFFVS